MTVPDATVVQWTPAHGPPRRIEFEPVPDGYRRLEREWTGCAWRTTGSEIVDQLDISLEADAPLAD